LPGQDSEFYEVEKRLAALGLERRDEETLSAWIGRIRSVGATDVALLEPALRLHYRLRFDPEGISPSERDSLRDQVQAWLRGSREGRQVVLHCDPAGRPGS
jgi:hypothetical protein